MPGAPAPTKNLSLRLRTSLLLLCLTAALPITALALIAASWIIDEENDRFIVSANVRNRATVSAIDAELRGSVNALLALSSSASLSAGRIKDFHDEAVAVLHTQSTWHDLILTDAAGQPLANARLAWGTKLLPSAVTPQAPGQIVANQQPAIGDLVMGSKLNEEPGIPVHVPVVRSAGEGYVLTAVLNPSALKRILVDQRMPAGWFSGLVDRNGRIVARVPEVPTGSMASPGYLAEVGKADEGWYRGKTIEGRDSFTAFYRSPMTGWTLGYAMPAEVVLAAPTRAAWLLGAGIVLSIASIVAIGLWLGRRITEPMAQLSEAAAALPRGERVAIPASAIREVSALATALDEASRAIETRDSALRQQAEELLRANTRKSEFLALLAHELRNPLAPLRNGVALITLQRDPKRLAEIQAMMDRHVRHMARLIEDLLDVSRIDRGELEMRRERVAVDAILTASIETVRPGIERHGQRLVVRYAPTPLFVDGDPVRLSQAVSNLLNNASKFTPQGGSIELESEAQGNEVVLRVTDSGVGFEPQDGERIFDLFVQADPKLSKTAGGLGIGLTLVRSIVGMHGGTVGAHSDGVGKGARFVVTLPVAAATPLEAPPASRAPVVETAQSARVMVVDDNRDAAVSLAELMRCNGFDARAAFNAPEALALATAFRPDVMFVDLHMPMMSGKELARRIKAMDWAAHVRIALVTGATDEDDPGTLQADGLDARFLKPISVQTAVSFASNQAGNVVPIRPGASAA